MMTKSKKIKLFKDKVTNILNSYKDPAFFIMLKDGIRLRPPKFSDKEIGLLTKWRNKNSKAYPTQFKATPKSTRKWLKKLVMERKDRILFMIEGPSSEIIGHLGISNIDFNKKICELDNVIRGVQGKYPGIMTAAVKAILEFGFDILAMHSFILRVFSENIRAIKFYQRCGFRFAREIPLKRLTENKIIKYVEMDSRSRFVADKMFTMMRIDKKK